LVEDWVDGSFKRSYAIHFYNRISVSCFPFHLFIFAIYTIMMPAKEYHSTVSSYYNEDVSLGFEKRAGENELLERIRKDFRDITSAYASGDALEIGCGPGFDVAWYAAKFPDFKITGIDISSGMVQVADRRIADEGVENAQVKCMDERDLTKEFDKEQFDLLFVFFGALNTVDRLDQTAADIAHLLKPGGHAVLTFVNKWYLREMLVQLLKLNIKGAFARIRKVWGGYSPHRHLPSRCYSPSQIQKVFLGMKLLSRRGYSIIFPAWYNFNKFKGKNQKLNRLWRLDQRLQKTFLWSKGEYTLFVFEKNPRP